MDARASMLRSHAGISEFYHAGTAIALHHIGPGIPPLLPPIAGFSLARYLLPPVAESGVGLEQAIVRRATCRSFHPAMALSLFALSRLLGFACGLTTPSPLEAAGVSYRRVAPSAGARYPIDVYPIVLRVHGVPPGVYHYQPNDHTLDLLRPGSFGEALAAWTLQQPYVADTGVVFALAGVGARMQARYGERGYRYILFEAGHIAQNLYLLSAAYGLGALAVGGFVDTALNRLLGLDGCGGVTLYLVAIGVPQLS
jgi:SagB-type dehydrogenase family enzyme